MFKFLRFSEKDQDLSLMIINGLKDYIFLNDDLQSKKKKIIYLAVSLMNLYIQINWWKINLKDDLDGYIISTNIDNDNYFSEKLNDGSKVINTLYKNLVLLYISKLVFTDFQNEFLSIPGFRFWQLRFLLLYQSSLVDERSQDLKPGFEGILEEISLQNGWDSLSADNAIRSPLGGDNFESESDLNVDHGNGDRNIDCLALFLIEAHCMSCLIGDINLSQNIINRLRSLTKHLFDPILTGALGKRTKFQKHDIAQLLLRVERKGTFDSRKYFDSDTEDTNNKMLPKDIFLDDDTLLDKIAYSATGAHPEPNPNLDQSPENAGNDLIDSSILVITNMERLILLATVRHINLLYPNDPLLFEQIQPYLDLILAPTLQSKSRITWSIKFSTLYQRCLCEVENKRKIERALTQAQELVDNLNALSSKYEEGDGKIDKHPIIPNENRMNMFYASGPPPSYYKLQKFLARILLKLGCVSSALDIFESLNMTADKISCYMALGRMDTAEKTILDSLRILEGNADASNIEKGNLYKLMGDIKSDPAYYEKAWDVSRNKCYQAQNAMGFYYLKKQKNLLKALSHFKISLQHFPSQSDILFTAGCLSMMIPSTDKILPVKNGCSEDVKETITNDLADLDRGDFGMSVDKENGGEGDDNKNMEEDANSDKVSKDVTGDADNRAFAENCFKRSLMLEPDNFKAWNNLASLQIKSENFVGACATLKESLKYNYHGSWQIWENLLYVATRRLDCEEMIWCLNSLLDILWGHEGVADNDGGVKEFVFDVNKASDNDGSSTSYNRFKDQSSSNLTVFSRLFPPTLLILVKELAMSTYSNKERNSPDDGGSSLIKPACIAQSQSMKRRLKTLFERISDNPKIWYLYGLLMLTFNKFGNDGYEAQTEDLSEKYQAAKYFIKAYRNQIAKNPRWFENKDLINETFNYLDELIQTSLDIYNNVTQNGSQKGDIKSTEIFDILTSAKFLTNNTIQRIKRTDNFGFTDAQTLQNMCNLEKELLNINDIIDKNTKNK
ncbi:tetratricopeptide repeat protein 27-like isoform X2 [Gordionus sp. m RMFG-2023]|uniref:tetratricopeptide repeat protein 27-like isoform X2 n=1 Tax=Gordionus sp. m RMFG-2023 TaxID=3053472 RepID=UPI0031FC96F3